VNLPFMNEPHHPRLGRYQHQHTRDWSETVDRADAFVIVMPEYNHGYTAPLKNALDYLHREWAYKPVGLVSYGGVAAGARAAQMIKPVLTMLRMMPLPEAVQIPFVAKQIDEDGALRPDPVRDSASVAMLDELVRWADALAPLRAAQGAASR
jgi:NAD(P)H-dependent FMN reductase